jgi:hypothetical protein
MKAKKRALTLELIPDLKIATLRAAYADGLKPSQLIRALLPLLRLDDCLSAYDAG